MCRETESDSFVDCRVTEMERSGEMEIFLKERNNPGKTVDLFLFMGQSNMAGRGVATKEHPEGAPALIEGAGYEYRAVSSPNRLYEIAEPFGRWENRRRGIDDGRRKTGSLVTAFVNAYYQNTGVPVVGVSASKGGSRISQWQPGGAFLNDVITRLKDAVSFLEAHHYRIRHRYMLWCQGESDGDIARPAAAYRGDFERMLEKMQENGIEKCFLIRIGNYNGEGAQDYTEIMRAQDEIARTNQSVVMVSTAFAGMKSRGLMKDDFHYYQEAYNEVGREAGVNTARYIQQANDVSQFFGY